MRRFLSTVRRPDILILDPRETKLLRNRSRVRAPRSSPAPEDTEELQKFLIRSTVQRPEKSFKKNKPSVEPLALEAIDALRPVASVLSRARSQQLKNELSHSFTRSQLLSYLKSHGVRSSMTVKSKLIDQIIARGWNLRVSADVNSDEDMIFHNSFDLSKRDFVLLLGKNGRIVREWTKSGAKIAVQPDTRQVLVDSTKATYNWILASLSEIQESIRMVEMDMTEFMKLKQPSDQEMSAIQRLTDTYFTFKDTHLQIYALEKSDAYIARRLLISLIPDVGNFKPCTWLYDVQEGNIPSYTFRPFSDNYALSWAERDTKWSRWEAIRSREPVKFSPSKHALLESPIFSTSTNSEDPLLWQNLAESLVKKLVAGHPKSSSLTLTATAGFILHSAASSLLPSAGMPKTFTTDIPWIAKLAGTLPLYGKDVAQEKPLAGWDLLLAHQKMKEEKNEVTPKSDALSVKQAFTAKKKDFAPLNTQLVQIKLVPEPGDAMVMNPPVEIWAPTNRGKINVEEAKIIRVPQEASSFISLPQHSADLKITLASTESVSQPLEQYLRKIEVGSHTYVPDSVSIEGVNYRYLSLAYVTQTELDFGGTMLQLLEIEGGKLGGHRIEANFVLHAEDSAEFNEMQGSKIVNQAVDLLTVLGEK